MAETVKRIAMGCDHAGFNLKKLIAGKLREDGYEIVDVGTDSTESVDYPKYGRAAASFSSAPASE